MQTTPFYNTTLVTLMKLKFLHKPHQQCESNMTVKKQIDQTNQPSHLIPEIKCIIQGKIPSLH